MIHLHKKLLTITTCLTFTPKVSNFHLTGKWLAKARRTGALRPLPTTFTTVAPAKWLPFILMTCTLPSPLAPFCVWQLKKVTGLFQTEMRGVPRCFRMSHPLKVAEAQSKQWPVFLTQFNTGHLVKPGLKKKIYGFLFVFWRHVGSTSVWGPLCHRAGLISEIILCN